MRVFISSIPAIIVFVLFCIPTIYLNSLFKRFDHCVELFKANKSVGISKDDDIIKEDCECLDIDEVFEKSME